MSARIARYLGAGRVVAGDNEPERIAMAARNGIEVLNFDDVEDIGSAVRDLTAGRAPTR